MLVSGLKNFNPRSESRRLSWSDNHGLEAKPPTRKAHYTQTFRCAGQNILNQLTESKERISAKFSPIESTVDWMEGSKNPETWYLCVRGCKWKEYGLEGWLPDYPESINFPALTPFFGSLSLRDPNLTY